MERDTVIFDLIKKECQRQKEGIELIASENFVSDEVMEAVESEAFRRQQILMKRGADCMSSLHSLMDC